MSSQLIPLEKALAFILAETQENSSNIDVALPEALGYVLAESQQATINVPDFDELCTRLRGRGQDDEAEIARRMDTAKWELDQWASFDYVISSQSKDADFVAITNIWQAEKRRSSRL